MGLTQNNDFKDVMMRYLEIRSKLSDLVTMDVQVNSRVDKDTIVKTGVNVDLAFADLLGFDPLTADVALEKATFIIKKIVISNDLAEYQKEALQQVLDDFTLFL